MAKVRVKRRRRNGLYKTLPLIFVTTQVVLSLLVESVNSEEFTSERPRAEKLSGWVKHGPVVQVKEVGPTYI